MKRYIKSFTTDQLKQQLGDNYPKGGYLYIFKHGIGPGTIPRDVQIVKTKDLPNGYTAVWLDRFLTTSELREYDIPSETRINELLGRIGYCQRDGDVVPCDEVEACGNVMASHMWDDEDFDWEDYGDPDSFGGFASPEDFENWYQNLGSHNMAKAGHDDSDVNACDKVVASEICYRDSDNDDRVVALDAGMSDEDVEEMLAAHPSYYRSTLDRFDDIDACDNVMASSRYEPDDSGIESYQAQCRSKKDNVLCIKYGDNQIDRYRFHSIDGLGDVFEPETGSGNWWTSYIVTPDNKLLSWQFNGRYTPVDATYGEDFWIETANEENIEATTEPKYFANMVNASEITASKYSAAEIQKAQVFLDSQDSEKVEFVEDVYSDILDLFADSIPEDFISKEKEIMRDARGIAEEDWGLSAAEADKLFNEIYKAVEIVNADEAASWC